MNALTKTQVTSLGGNKCRGAILIFFKFIAMLLFAASTVKAFSQQAENRQLTQQEYGELEKKYKSCTDGYYSGPRPNRVRYTKDEYIWAVTPEFAAKYCMPESFIDKELKGADAIAYRTLPQGAEQCGFGGNKEVCSAGIDHVFEIYYKSNIPIKAISDTKYSHRAFYMIPASKHVLSSNINKRQIDVDKEYAERPGKQKKYENLSMIGYKGSKPVWPILALYQIQFYENLLPGYNYLSVHGSMGGFGNPRMVPLKVNDFALVIDMPNETRDDEVRDLRTDYAHVIYLPKKFVAQVRQVDEKGASEFKQLIKRALPELNK
ncbi:hypothetical protein AEP_01706 [Curvibacter sp. AEP1-3]|uniref:hypothetical protein n=1 Tax=Curvibacter sp. AEP1-3 TaxID=1844971 RepID=UPI000B577E91|nr:hypothetical protein [Curvibacter sp. AEP1-3]ARV18650.1 hypothetical protein AEP_01706 [Curvibacter sp. AEP1-3]